MERGKRIWIVALVVLLLAGAVRFYKLNWDSTEILDPDASFHAPLIAHPDERGFLTRVQKLGVEGWNPRTYGPLPLYLIKFASSAVAKFVDPVWTEYRHTALVGRFLSALFGTATILVTFLLGRRAFSVPVGVFSALLLAVNVLHIQASHFAAPDTFLAFFVQLTLLLAMASVQRGNLALSAFCGIAAGFAIASKFNGIGLAPVVIVAAWMHAKRRTALPIAITAMVAAFLAGAPYALLDPASFWGRIATEQTRVVGANLPWNVQQYIRTAPLMYPLEQMVVWGFGIPAGLLVVAAMLWSVKYVFRAEADVQKKALILILLWLIPGFLLTSVSQIRLPRYLLPFYPQLCLLAGLMLSAMLQSSRALRIAATSFAVIAVAGSFLWMLAFLRIYSVPHPYVQATKSAQANVPPASRIALEEMNEEVPINLQSRFQMGVRLPMFQRPEGDEKIAYISRVLSLADYFSLPNLTVSATVLGLSASRSAAPGDFLSIWSSDVQIAVCRQAWLRHGIRVHTLSRIVRLGDQRRSDRFQRSGVPIQVRSILFPVRPPQNNPVPEP